MLSLGMGPRSQILENDPMTYHQSELFRDLHGNPLANKSTKYMPGHQWKPCLATSDSKLKQYSPLVNPQFLGSYHCTMFLHSHLNIPKLNQSLHKLSPSIVPPQADP